MAKKPTKRVEFVLFDVLYEDGTLRSNRRVPGDVLGGITGDEAARAAIAEQDSAIAQRSGLAPMRIKNIRRAGAKKWPGEIPKKAKKAS